MTTRYRESIAELGRLLEVTEPGVHVRRTEVQKDGALVFTVQQGDTTRWFLTDQGALTELFPTADPELRICRRLSELGDDLQVLSWRPGRRIVLSEIHDGERQFIKGYRRKRAEPIATRFTCAWLACQSAPSFRIPRVRYADKEHHALVLEGLDGVAPRARTKDADVHFRIGSALRRFQAEVPCDDFEAHAAQSEIALLAKLQERQRAWALAPDGWEALCERLAAISDRIPTADPVAAHRDLYDAQLLVSESGVGLLDLDLLSGADPALDAANYTAHLQLRALQQVDGANQQGAEAASVAFLDGLEFDGDESFNRALRFYQASTFLRLAFLYELRPRWPHLVPVLVQYAARCLHDLR